LLASKARFLNRLVVLNEKRLARRNKKTHHQKEIPNIEIVRLLLQRTMVFETQKRDITPFNGLLNVFSRTQRFTWAWWAKFANQNLQICKRLVGS